MAKRINVVSNEEMNAPWADEVHQGDYDTTGLRTFESGATRDSDAGKPEYAGFLAPSVIRRFGTYMHDHRLRADGSMRGSDDWKKGMPLDVYLQSMFRHFVDVWEMHEDIKANAGSDDHTGEVQEEALCALLFNVQGYLYERLKLERLKRIYVAGPYSQGDTEDNVIKAIRIGNRLIGMGFAPFVPHLSHYQHLLEPQDYETWMRIDFTWVETCDAVLRLPGESPGADREVKYAGLLGIPVYTNVEDLESII